jgi:hypothetical protein
MSDLDQRPAESSAPLCAPITPAASAADDQMRPNATGCDIYTKCEISPTHLNTPDPDPAPLAPAPSRPLNEKQYAALDFLLGRYAYDDDYICTRLRIHRSTLSRWKHQHPLFMAEMHRRRQELWNDVAGDLHFTATRAIQTLRDQLSHLSDNTTRLRAARTVLHLVKANRVSPAAANPPHLNDILDQLLQRQQPSAPAAAATGAADKPAFTDAQRQALLNQLLQADADAQAQDDAQALARRQARLERAAAKAPTKPTHDEPDSKAQPAVE